MKHYLKVLTIKSSLVEIYMQHYKTNNIINTNIYDLYKRAYFTYTSILIAILYYLDI